MMAGSQGIYRAHLPLRSCRTGRLTRAWPDRGPDAQRSRAPIQRLADTVSGWFVPAVIAVAAIAFIVWSLIGPSPAMGYGLIAAVAVLIWLVSVIGEGMADAQMERFRGNPANKGQVCRDGLWRYSRHPNYFFEAVHWLAYIPLAIGAPYGWVTLGAPLVMAFLLTQLSGMPLLEKEMAARKPGYAEYMRQTSALIPWPPKA